MRHTSLQGRKFDNVSTLEIGWSLSNPDVAKLATTTGVLKPTNQETNLGYEKLHGGHQLLTPTIGNGVSEVDVSVTLKSSSSYFGSSITDTLELSFVQDPEIEPSQTDIFNHPDNVGSLKISHGSGFFDVSVVGDNKVNAQYHPSNQTIAVTPLKDGRVNLKLRDLCLPPGKAEPVTAATVNVVSVYKAVLMVQDKVQRGSSLEAKVRLYDQNGNRLFPDKISKFCQVEVQDPAGKNVLKIKSGGSSRSEGADLMFDLLGHVVGDTQIRAYTKSGDRVVASPLMPVQVFPQLRLDPENITLVIGAKFQVAASGGPNVPDATMEYMVNGPKSASANADGVITGKKGGLVK